MQQRVCGSSHLFMFSYQYLFQSHYLPAPFKAFGTESCVEDFDLPSQIRQRTYNMTYSRSFCQTVCLQTRVQKECGCRLTDVSFTGKCPFVQKTCGCRMHYVSRMFECSSLRKKCGCRMHDASLRCECSSNQKTSGCRVHDVH